MSICCIAFSLYTNHRSQTLAQEKVDKYRKGYAAPGMRRAFLPAVVSTSVRLHGGQLRLPAIPPC